jgi:glutaredoxin
MSMKDYVNAARSKKPAAGGDGKATTRGGEVLDLELYKFDSCPYCQRVFEAVRRLGVPVRYRDIHEDAAAAKKLVEVGGDDQVPCLFIDGKPLYESADIIAFLEEKFGAGKKK